MAIDPKTDPYWELDHAAAEQAEREGIHGGGFVRGIRHERARLVAFARARGMHDFADAVERGEAIL